MEHHEFLTKIHQHLQSIESCLEKGSVTEQNFAKPERIKLKRGSDKKSLHQISPSAKRKTGHGLFTGQMQDAIIVAD